MGGKQKQAQRTKNNARPSNSGRSAELLGTSVPQFTPFSSMKETGFSMTTFSLAPIDDFDSSVDTNFQLVLKKMNKKDATTKLKALQEFADLIRNSDPEAVKAILPFWPRLYCLLSTDVEHRVREASHVAHRQVVMKAKRNLAPYLKQLAGPWFTAQYDTYPPAATAATQSLKDAFPNDKLQGAIVFCQDEILNYICDNLTVQSAQSMNNAKNYSVDECKAKYERILISCLQGYALYLLKIPEDALHKVEDVNGKILSNNKFWKLARHESAQVRAAWFTVVTALCQKAAFLMQKEAGNVVKAVFVNLDETDLSVQSNLWEAALLTVTTIPEWWKHININDMFLPKLWKVLKEAGQGNATTIYPNFLPLLSHLPQSLETETFFDKFFEYMRAGLEHKSVKTSQSESRAISVSLIECLQYTILRNQSNSTLCENLIKLQLIPILEYSIENGQQAYKTLFNQVSSLAQYWHRNRHNPDFASYDALSNIFWDKICLLFQTQIYDFTANCDSATALERTSRQIEFMMCMKHTVKPKRQLKVQFSESSVKSVDAVDSKEANLTPEQPYLMLLDKLVLNSCEHYINAVSINKVPAIVENVYSLLLEFENERILNHINIRCASGDANTSFINIYNNLLLRWIQDKDLFSKSIIDLVFLLFKYLQPEEKSGILNDLIDLQKTGGNKKNWNDCLCWCIAKALSYPHNADVSVQKWLSNDKVSEFFINIIHKEIAGDCPTHESLLLKQCFNETNCDGELFISKECVMKIISELTKCLLSPSKHPFSIDSCASFAAYISSITYTDDLLLALFTLGCNDKVDPDTLSKDTIWEVNTAWQDGIASLNNEIEKSELLALAEKFALIFERKLMDNDIKDFSLKEIAKQINSFLFAIKKSFPLYVGDVVKVFFNRDFVGKWRKRLMPYVRLAEYISGDYSCVDIIKLQEMDIKDVDIVKYFMWKSLITNVAASRLENNDVCSKTDDSSDESDERIVIEFSEDVEHLILELLFDSEIGMSFKEHYKSNKYYEKLVELHESITDKLIHMLHSMGTPLKKRLDNILVSNMESEDGWLWCKVANNFRMAINVSSYETYESKLKSNSAKVNLMQTFARDLTYDNIQRTSSTFESIVTLRCLMHCQEIEVQIAEVFNKIEILKNNEMQSSFYNVDFSNWQEVQIIIEVLQLCSKLIEHGKIDTLSMRHWDFIVVSLATWSEKLNRVKIDCENAQMALFITAVAKLYINVEIYIQKLQSTQPQCNHIHEWNNVFAQSITTDIIKIWLNIAERYSCIKENLALEKLPFLQEFGKVILYVNFSYIFKKRNENMPKWSKLLKQSCRLIKRPTHCLQLWGYHMLIMLAPGLIELDSISVDTNTPHEKGMIFGQFKTPLVETHNIVKAMLLDYKLGEASCRVEPFTDSYTYTFAYLLLWSVLLNLCEKSSTEVKYQYADWLRKEDLLTSLLSSTFKLLPSDVLRYFEGRNKPLSSWFLEKPPLLFDDPITSEKIERMVCWVYASTLTQLPASVRQWWKDVETRTSQIVERVTSAYVSPHLCSEELKHVMEHETKFRNMVIKVHPTVREVVATYTVDDSPMDLVITLPLNYPLCGPKVECGRQIGGAMHKNWLMQLDMCVTHKNGRIWDALSQWQNSLNKKFDGVEECYICFAVLHPGTYQLPKLSCKTCRKKFHAACLYKWFSTSNKSTCPICRNLF